jgi:transposase
MHLLGEFDRLPNGNYVLGGAQMNYVGIDHHRQYSHLTLMDEDGQVLRSGRAWNVRREIEKFLEGLKDVEAVIESGRSSYTMVDVLEEMGVAVRAIAQAKVKTDQRNSSKLARLLRLGIFLRFYKRSPENRQAQQVLRQRAFYVRKQTSVKNRLRALLAQQRE